MIQMKKGCSARVNVSSLNLRDWHDRLEDSCRRPSDVVRMALEAFLQAAPPSDRKPAERVDHLLGSLASGVPDLAERHREYVIAALKHAR